MRTNIKFPLIYLVLLVTGSLFLTSCQDDDEYYSVGDYLLSFGIVEKVNENATDNVVVRLDNGDKAVSVVPLHHWIELTAGQRVLVNFAPFDDKMNTDSSMTYYGKFNRIQNILYKDILELSEIDDDSIGNDPVNIQKTWLTGDSILNVKFAYYTQGSTHYINMVDNGEGNGVDNAYIFEFRHNDRGDVQGYPVTGYVSFKLNPIKITGQDEVDFKIRYTDYEGKTTEIPYTLSY
jgi:hypothetical protein